MVSKISDRVSSTEYSVYRERAEEKNVINVVEVMKEEDRHGEG
jgi:hypothetical protein